MIGTSGEIAMAEQARAELQRTLEDLRDGQARGVGARELATAITKLQEVGYWIRTARDLVSEAGQ